MTKMNISKKGTGFDDEIIKGAVLGIKNGEAHTDTLNENDDEIEYIYTITISEKVNLINEDNEW